MKGETAAKTKKETATKSSVPKKPVDESKSDEKQKNERMLTHATSEYYIDVESDQSKLWTLMCRDLPREVDFVEKQIVQHATCTLARTRNNFDHFGAYQATSYSVRDHLIKSWNMTQKLFTEKDCKRVYYMSLEFLMGRSLQNAILNLEIQQPYKDALAHLGFKLEDLYDEEQDAALGNGGLGRLAACFMDSLASLNYPAWGYGIRYQYGMFKQKMIDGYQMEDPDYWLNFGNPWEIPRQDVQYHVRFGGHVDVESNGRYKWTGGHVVVAMAYDVPIPGFNTLNTNNIRLWDAKPSHEFDLMLFNEGDYLGSIEARSRDENISRVLYPNDTTQVGKELRLQQQYFFVSATLQDIIRRFKKEHDNWDTFPSLAAIQLNDTHPSLGIPELMRLLLDVYFLPWDQAWKLTTEVFSFTNHTVLPEALEKWSVKMVEKLLPRHLQIIYHINHLFLKEVAAKFPDDKERVVRMSIIEEGDDKRIRMAYLAIVGSHKVNGVAAIHSDLLKTTIFKDFFELWPEKFTNMTNGVTPRRWLYMCNPSLSRLISRTINIDEEEWLIDMAKLKALVKHIDDQDVQAQFQKIKHHCKEQLAKYCRNHLSVELNTNALFDIQVKRIHEYKRQLLNILGVIHRYLALKKLPAEERIKRQKRVFFFAGKAAPGYAQAKRVIKLITSVGEVVNNDPEIGDLLKVVFIPNYNVSLAEIIIPASDISEHISTAGTEASGTSNMKFAMNGGLIIGTLDGANIEIREEVGDDCMFVFGARAEEVAGLRDSVRNNPDSHISPALREVVDAVLSGKMGPVTNHKTLIESILHGRDFYLVTHDFDDYIKTQERIDEEFHDKANWTRKCLKSVASMGKFSSDRTIHEYAKEIWDCEPVRATQMDFCSCEAKHPDAESEVSAARACDGSRSVY
eukprot:GCRY01001793.1.p1 GENE.GCRY01001793.1~~GCRY01001793.1.p1  ORF type:complete len:918 (+),score=322.28 GCRY01001793.1:35-2755(+)